MAAARSKALYCSAAAIVAVWSAPGSAQSVDAAAAQGNTGQAAAPAQDTGGAEIVVTANKREQSINDVGITVSALGGAELQKRGINNIQDLAKNVPTLQYAPSVNNTPIFTIRGVGFVESSLAAYPTVSVSLDQIPLPFPALTALTAFDLERVEVLKGPQGTLFGQNTTGGAINYVAAKPTDHLTAGVSLTGGRFGRFEGEAYVSAPLTETLSVRASTRIVRQDDWVHSLTHSGEQGKVETYAGRLLVDFKPSDRVRFELNLNGWQDKSDPGIAQYAGIGAPQVPATVDPRLLDASLPGFQPLAPHNARYADWTQATPPYANNKLGQVALRGDVDLTDNLTATSITSYVDYHTHTFTDGDGTALVVEDVPLVGSIRSFSQELRFANNPHQPFRFVAGGNYSNDKVFEQSHALFSDQSAGRALGLSNNVLTSQQSMNNYAVFGNVEYDLVPRVTVKGGIRYTEADRTGHNCTQGADNGATSAFTAALRDQLLGQPVGTTRISDSECFTLDFSQPDIPVTGAPYRQTLNENNISWRAGVDYKPVKGVLLYGNVAKGYKAGSITPIGATTTLAYRSVTQESVMSYEVGFKADVIHRLLNVTGAAYYYDYRNKQLRAKIIPPPPTPFRTLEALDNIPKSRIWGTELEAHLYPARGLSFNAAAAYTNGKIQRYDGVNAAGFAETFDGTRMPFAPRWQLSGSGDYEWSMGSLKPFVGGTVNYHSSETTIIGGEQPLGTVGFSTSGTTPFVVHSYTLVDLRAGVEFGDGKWRLSVFGKNVFNKFYVLNIFQTFDTIVRFPGMPATYGATIAWSFK